MSIHPRQRRLFISYAALYLVFAAASARAFFTVQNSADVGFLTGMLALYLLLLLAQPWLIARNLLYLHGINALQTGIGLALLLTVGKLDYFSLLFIPPCAQSILNFPRKIALGWIFTIGLLMIAALLAVFPLDESIGYVIIYPTAIFLFSGMSYLALQAERAQLRSEMLLADLQAANQKLRTYAAQVQELAAAAERNRLARELHDSVTQIVFGLTLSAQAARILIDRDPPRAVAELDHLQVLAQSALAEMRALIQQLHPRSMAEEGLAAGLHRLVAEHQSNHGLSVDLQVTGEQRLPAKIEEELFCIAQEALNNIVKHARTDRAMVTLNLEDVSRVWMAIEDNGIGFDPNKVKNLPGHLGLVSMAERIQELGGSLVIDSKAGKGTSVRVDLAMAQEVEHA
jgi:signal transduction histidine kinase